eukprot:4458093-Prymnesium_polylepis.1
MAGRVRGVGQERPPAALRLPLLLTPLGRWRRAASREPAGVAAPVGTGAVVRGDLARRPLAGAL